MVCFACNNSSNNQECNVNAVDEPCDASNKACITIHDFDPYLTKTISITKQCVEKCSKEMIDCEEKIVNGQLIKSCKYCCTARYCNFNVPINTKEAEILSRDALIYPSSASYYALNFALKFFLVLLVLRYINF